MRATCGVLSARTPSVRPLSWSTNLNVLRSSVRLGPRQERLDVLHQRWDDQLAAVTPSHIDQAATQRLDVARLSGQHVGDVLGQQPCRGHGRNAGD